MLDEIATICLQVKKEATHPFLLQHLDIPLIPETKLEYLYLFLKNAGLDAEQIRVICTSIALAQLGTDIHENIGIEGFEDKKSQLHKQLLILGGDYITSKYYLNLTNAGYPELIPRISQALSEINQSKMILYNTSRKTLLFPLFLFHYKRVETALYTCVLTRPDSFAQRQALLERFLLLDQWLKKDGFSTSYDAHSVWFPTIGQILEETGNLLEHTSFSPQISHYFLQRMCEYEELYEARKHLEVN